MASFGLTIRRTGWAPRTEQFYNQLLVGLETTLVPVGHTLAVKIVADRAEDLATFDSWARSGLVQATVLHDLNMNDPLEETVKSLGLPYVLLGDVTQRDGAASVVIDNAAALLRLLTYLVELGHRRIDWITGPRQQVHTSVRLGAYERFMLRAGVEGGSHVGDYTAARCADIVRDLLQAARRPTALVVDGDYMSQVALATAQQLGCHVPEELSLVSWDDSLLCQGTDPPLTALNHRVRDLGHTLAQALMRVIDGEQVHLDGPDPELIVRGSCAAPPSLRTSPATSDHALLPSAQ